MLQKNMKISEGTEFKIDGDYCLYKSGFFQKWSRWWFDENHKKTFKYLDEDFTEFFSYCTRIVNSISIPIVNGIQLK